jgi:hypothetical protein
VDRVYFGCGAADAARAGFDDAFLYEEFRREPSERRLPVIAIPTENAWESFEAWSKSRDKVLY